MGVEICTRCNTHIDLDYNTNGKYFENDKGTLDFVCDHCLTEDFVCDHCLTEDFVCNHCCAEKEDTKC